MFLLTFNKEIKNSHSLTVTNYCILLISSAFQAFLIKRLLYNQWKQIYRDKVTANNGTCIFACLFFYSACKSFRKICSFGFQHLHYVVAGAIFFFHLGIVKCVKFHNYERKVKLSLVNFCVGYYIMYFRS